MISKILLSYQQAVPLLDGIGLYPLYYQLDAMAAKNKFESNADSCQYNAYILKAIEIVQNNPANQEEPNDLVVYLNGWLK
ncbi:MAG: hypothetical protein IPN20_23935 [Haliscomenobacter sp.]|nr:hypothetical protein [Haliscomenobacter sp.]MBK8656881.1 hypothetical protein [Haliscomenobacter sp.]